VLLAFGTLPAQAEAQRDPAMARAAIDVNLTAAACLLELFAARMEARGRGWIAGISSVAGDRGRQSNYIYGAAKAGLTAYLAGLRNRLAKKGVHVVTVKPGFVDTPMTHGMVNPKSPLVASPERVAAGIVRAIRRRRNVVYLPWFWRAIMGVVTRVPEAIFKRMKL
jgi:short-subunit dehydrogenase